MLGTVMASPVCALPTTRGLEMFSGMVGGVVIGLLSVGLILPLHCMPECQEGNGACTPAELLEKVFCQPSPTCRHIITVNPTMVAMVARSVLPWDWDSGMSSSTATKIIAPAAKARA